MSWFVVGDDELGEGESCFLPSLRWRSSNIFMAMKLAPPARTSWESSALLSLFSTCEYWSRASPGGSVSVDGWMDGWMWRDCSGREW